jgi:phosphoglycolate phosphatase
MAYDILLFDVDGTLCDPGPSMIESARYALEQLGVHETDESALRRLIGPPLEHAFRDNYNFDETKTKEAVRFFREKLQSDGIKLYEAYPGISELLKELSESGKTLAVVTSKIQHIAVDVLENTGLIQYFKVIGAQQPNNVVEKEVILFKTLAELGITDISNVVMIGDRRHDVEAAKVHDVHSIGVLWGYGEREELENEGATHVVKNVKELGDILLSN